MTRDASRPGICFCKLRNGHSPLTPLCSFLVTVCNSIYSWHFTISQWDFSHCLDPCRCLQWLKSALRHRGFTGLHSTFCRAQPSTWHIPPRTRAITHRLVTWHIRDDKQYRVLLSDFTNGVWRPSTVEDAVLYLCSYSLIFIYNLCREALSSTLNARDSHGPLQPLPRVLR